MMFFSFHFVYVLYLVEAQQNRLRTALHKNQACTTRLRLQSYLYDF